MYILSVNRLVNGNKIIDDGVKNAIFFPSARTVGPVASGTLDRKIGTGTGTGYQTFEYPYERVFFSSERFRVRRSRHIKRVSQLLLYSRPFSTGMHFTRNLITVLSLWLLVQVVVSMRLVVQRVHSASVTVVQEEGKVLVSQIGAGLLALVGLHEHDTKVDLQYCCKRLVACKLWDNANGGLWRHSVKQKQLDCLLVSQFTLHGTLSKKNQPDYKLAMKALPAEAMYQQFVEMVRNEYQADRVHDGVFGAMMDVALVNDGPVTIIIDSKPQPPPNAVALVDAESENLVRDDQGP